MDELEQQISAEVEAAIFDYMESRPRSEQKVLGVSEIGVCRELIRRKLIGEEPTDTRLRMDAFAGSAVGEWVELAIQHRFPEAIRQHSVDVDLPSGSYHLPGSPDVVFSAWIDGYPLVMDVKSQDGLEMAVREEALTLQRLFQRSAYALALHQEGVFGDTPVEQVRVANVFVDRSGSEDHVVTRADLFSWEAIYEGEEFLADAIYAAKHNEFASRDKPRAFCQKFCEHFSSCRGRDDTDVAGLIEDPETVSAIELYVEGMELSRAGDKKKSEAKKHLKGITGNTDKFAVREVHVGESEVPGYTRKPHTKIDIRRIK